MKLLQQDLLERARCSFPNPIIFYLLLTRASVRLQGFYEQITPTLSTQLTTFPYLLTHLSYNKGTATHSKNRGIVFPIKNPDVCFIAWGNWKSWRGREEPLFYFCTFPRLAGTTKLTAAILRTALIYRKPTIALVDCSSD